MLDFTAATALELSHAIEAERQFEADRRKWRRRLRELNRRERAAVRRAVEAALSGRDRQTA